MGILDKETYKERKEMTEKDFLGFIKAIDERTKKYLLARKEDPSIPRDQIQTYSSDVVDALVDLTINLHERVKELEAEKARTKKEE